MNEESYASGWPEWLWTTHHIGSHYPYYEAKNPDEFSLSISDIVRKLPNSERTLDINSVVEIIFGRYPLGDRTLISGVRRTPWLAEPIGSGWQYHSAPRHGRQKQPINKVVSELQTSLRQETREYIESADTVGILLSGGLDSRIVAGILRELQLNDDSKGIVALSWGMENSRDVVYARQIAERYDWEFRHFPIDVDVLRRNIRLTGELGAEFAPYHLHALPDIREQDDIDVILAGSYGNSVGRAKYGGTHVLDVEKTVPRWLNRFGLLSHEAVSGLRETIHGDAYGYRTRICRTHTYQYRELEKQLHYMRRGLQSCMSHVAEQIPLYQLFTSPDVVELMWRLDPATRGKQHYIELLNRLPGELETIPNVKSGTPPGRNKPTADNNLSVEYHNYGNWLRDDLRDDIINLVWDGPLRGTIFNDRSLEKLLKIWPQATTTTTNKLDSTISWLASLSIFIETYDLEISNLESNSVIDRFNTYGGLGHAFAYQTARDFVRE